MTSVENSQHQRDLRSADRDFKRHRDNSAKWSNGKRPLAGVPYSKWDDITRLGSEAWDAEPARCRPGKKYSDEYHATKKRDHNIVKSRANYDLPAGRVRQTTDAKLAVKEAASMTKSLTEFWPTTPLADKETLSLSNSTSWTLGTALPLGMFVKPNGRDTERLVEKEYEVLDDNGQAIKGHKRRAMLRRGGDPDSKSDDGFELI